MWQTKDEMKCENVKMSAYSDTYCIPTQYETQQIITSLADERIEDEGYEMKYEWQGGIEKKIVREENELEKNENESEWWCGRAFQRAGAWK